jgi:hypothetical protein
MGEIIVEVEVISFSFVLILNKGNGYFRNFGGRGGGRGGRGNRGGRGGFRK